MSRPKRWKKHVAGVDKMPNNGWFAWLMQPPDKGCHAGDRKVENLREQLERTKTVTRQLDSESSALLQALRPSRLTPRFGVSIALSGKSKTQTERLASGKE